MGVLSGSIRISDWFRVKVFWDFVVHFQLALLIIFGSPSAWAIHVAAVELTFPFATIFPLESAFALSIVVFVVTFKLGTRMVVIDRVAKTAASFPKCIKYVAIVINFTSASLEDIISEVALK